MKILIHSFTFWPAVGGIESVVHVLAQGLVKIGHQVTVLTETTSSNERTCLYSIVRTTDRKVITELINECDLIFSVGSLRYFLEARRSGKPFVLNHPTYQLTAIDGFGWDNDAPAPLSPLPSYIHHVRVHGLAKATAGLYRLLSRRCLTQFVDANVAVSRWQANRQPLPRQTVIYNPVELDRFIPVGETDLEKADATFTFLGRLISEKGVDDLIRAFAHIAKTTNKLTLKIIGDGAQMETLKSLARECGMEERVKFLGSLVDDRLEDEVRKSGICVLPSAWEEPMGLTGIELMAAGKPLIISARGGLAECVGDAAVVFPNRDYLALATCMEKLRTDKVLQQKLVRNGQTQIKQFAPEKNIEAYARLFEKVLKDRK